MKRIILVAMVFLIFTSVMHLDGQWTRTYGGSDIEIANSIQQTSDGGYIVAGYTGYSELSGTDYDFWVLKLTPTGNIEWQCSYGGIEVDSAKSIQQTNDGGYIVAGYTESFGAGGQDFWVLKLDSTGAVEWQKTYGGAFDEIAHSIQQTSDGGYIVAGSACLFGPGGSDSWVLKLTSTGDIVWQRRYDGSSIEHATSIQQTSDGGYIVAGYTNSFGAGEMDFWVLKLTSTGDIEWQQTYGRSDWDLAYSIQQTSDGGYIVAGWTETFGPEDWRFWILKLTSAGEIEWQYAYGEGSQNVASSVQQTIDGGYVVAGRAFSRDAGGYNLWVLKLTSIGDIEWQRIYDGSRDEEAYSIQQTSDGGYIVAGETFSFGVGECDFLILKLLPDGDIDPSCWFIRSSNAIITGTYVSPNGTSTMPRDTNVVPLDTVVTPRDTNATAALVCDGPKYDLTIYVTAGGTTNPSPGAHTYYIGTVFRIEALADIGYRFSEWTGDVPPGQENDNPITITMDSDKSITANFIRQYTLTIAAGTGGTTNPAPGTYTHDPGAQVIVQAVPSSGYQFTGWSGDASGTTNPITITMVSDKSIKANFSRTTTGDGGETGKKGGCFIATAGYGSSLHPRFKTLRDFRDKYLMSNKLGRMLVNLYYRYSPFAAEFITKHKALRIVVRINLLPLVAFSYSMVRFGPIFTMVIFIFVLLIFFILFYWRRFRRTRAKSIRSSGSFRYKRR
jgi:uncharacterized repeat protein (TIGR02543 family)/uncharacterized delta-60 repeat protein